MGRQQANSTTCMGDLYFTPNYPNLGCKSPDDAISGLRTSDALGVNDTRLHKGITMLTHGNTLYSICRTTQRCHMATTYTIYVVHHNVDRWQHAIQYTLYVVHHNVDRWQHAIEYTVCSTSQC